MKVKNFLIALSALIATFIYPEVTTWLIPLVISVITLIKYRKIDFAKYVGFLSLKPIFMFFLIWLAANFNFLERLYSTFSYEIGSAIFRIVPELTLTLVIVYVFRNLILNDKLAWLFLLGDIVRWSSLFIESLISDPIPEPYFYTQFYIVVFFYLVFPPLYAIVALLSVRERALSQNNIGQQNQPHPSKESARERLKRRTM